MAGDAQRGTAKPGAGAGVSLWGTGTTPQPRRASPRLAVSRGIVSRKLTRWG